jgi:hypothetical protein
LQLESNQGILTRVRLLSRGSDPAHFILVCIAVTMMTHTLGCGSSPAPKPAAAPAESYVRQAMAREIAPVRTTPEVFVYCRRLGPAQPLLCQGTVTSANTHEVLASQRWSVVVRASTGRVTGAHALDPSPATALAATVARDRRRAAQQGPRTATLSVTVPTTVPSYVCVDDGHGKILFTGVLTAGRHMSFRRPHLRLSVGNASVRILVNGNTYRIPLSPFGLDVLPDRVSFLPAALRPCTG